MVWPSDCPGGGRLVSWKLRQLMVWPSARPTTVIWLVGSSSIDVDWGGRVMVLGKVSRVFRRDLRMIEMGTNVRGPGVFYL